MRIIALIGIGSFVGGILRYLTTLFIQTKFLSTFPYGTLTVNVLGSLIIGIVFGLSEKFNLSPEWRLFVATGLCGGFTTFSAFSLETMSMIQEGQYFYSIGYVALSILLGLLAVFLGMMLIKIV